MKKKTLLFLIAFPLVAVVAYAAVGILLFMNHNSANAVDLLPEATCTVTFDTRGGSAVDAVQVANGRTITEPVTNRANYKFLGWYLNLDDNQTFDFTTEIQSNITLYAKWVEIYTVTFETNGGSVVGSVRLTRGQIVNAVTTNRAGYVLLGWYLDVDCIQKFEFVTPITDNTKLYAKWARDITDDCDFELAADGTYVITGYHGTSTELAIIPQTYNGKPVTAITDHAFEDCITLTQIIIPKNIISVGSYAFLGCNLTVIYCEIPEPINYVPDGWNTNWYKYGIDHPENIWWNYQI